MVGEPCLAAAQLPVPVPAPPLLHIHPHKLVRGGQANPGAPASMCQGVYHMFIE